MPPYFIIDLCSSFVLARGWPKFAVFPPWTVERSHEDAFTVKGANGLVLATVHCRDDLQKWSFGHKLSSEEARRIAKQSRASLSL